MPRIGASEPSFASLPEEKKARDIFSRFEQLAANRELFFDGEFVEDLLRDLSDPSFMARKAYRGLFYSCVIGQIDLESDRKLANLVEVYDEISPSLKAVNWDGETAESRLVSQLLGHSFNKKYDLFRELDKLANTGSAEELTFRLLPDAIVYFEHPYPEIYAAVPESRRASVDQRIVERSAVNGGYQLPAMELYLRGGGEPGVHQGVVGKWFAEPKWYWEHAEPLRDLLQSDPTGIRRDTIISEMLYFVAKSDVGVAREWIEEIDDPGIRASALEALPEQ